jgi:hypothetical protein
VKKMKLKSLGTGQESNHQHCWHAHRGPIWTVIPDGMILQNCCKCQATRMIHVDHTYSQWRPLKPERWMVNGVSRREIY